MSNRNKQEGIYNNILEVHDILDRVIDEIEKVSSEENRTVLIDVIEPIIKQAHASADNVADIFLDYVESNKTATQSHKKQIESSLRAIFISLMELPKNLKTIAN